MQLSSRSIGSVRVLAVEGRLDHAHAQPFETGLAPHLVECHAAGSPLLLDFSQVQYISSVGLRVLMLAAKQVKAQHGRVAIAALTPVVREVFQVSHFDMLLQVFADLESAAAELSK